MVGVRGMVRDMVGLRVKVGVGVRDMVGVSVS